MSNDYSHHDRLAGSLGGESPSSRASALRDHARADTVAAEALREHEADRKGQIAERFALEVDHNQARLPGFASHADALAYAAGLINGGKHHVLVIRVRHDHAGQLRFTPLVALTPPPQNIYEQKEH